jgi:hypothetical protein
VTAHGEGEARRQFERRLVYRREVTKEVSDGAADAFKAIVTFTVFLLAVSLVLVQGHLHSAEERVLRAMESWT